MSPLSTPRERQLVVTFAAATAAHGLLAAGHNLLPAQLVDKAFEIAEAFVHKTEQEALKKGVTL